MPAAVQSNTFCCNPCGSECPKCAFKIARNSDQNIDRNDDKREHLEPMGASDLSPRVLDRHEADTSGQCRIYLGVMEPAVHLGMGRIGERPLHSHSGANLNDQTIDRHSTRHAEEEKHTASFCAARYLIQKDQSNENHCQTEPLI